MKGIRKLAIALLFCMLAAILPVGAEEYNAVMGSAELDPPEGLVDIMQTATIGSGISNYIEPGKEERIRDGDLTTSVTGGQYRVIPMDLTYSESHYSIRYVDIKASVSAGTPTVYLSQSAMSAESFSDGNFPQAPEAIALPVTTQGEFVRLQVPEEYWSYKYNHIMLATPDEAASILTLYEIKLYADITPPEPEPPGEGDIDIVPMATFDSRINAYIEPGKEDLIRDGDLNSSVQGGQYQVLPIDLIFEERNYPILYAEIKMSATGSDTPMLYLSQNEMSKESLTQEGFPQAPDTIAIPITTQGELVRLMIPAEYQSIEYNHVMIATPNSEQSILTLYELRLYTNLSTENPDAEREGYQEVAARRRAFANTGSAAYRVNDCSTATSWSADPSFSGQVELGVDLGRSYPLAFIELQTGTASALQIVTANNPSFTDAVTVGTVTEATGADDYVTIPCDNSGYARYIGVLQQTAGTPMEIIELRAYTDGEYTKNYIDVAQKQMTLPSGTSASGLLNGNEEDIVSTEETDGYVGVDLGQPYALEHIELIFPQDNSASKNFVVSLSNDKDFAEETIVVNVGNTPLPASCTYIVEDIVGEYRFIRFKNTGTKAAISEIRAYADPDQIVYPWSVTADGAAFDGTDITGVSELTVSASVNNRKEEKTYYLLVAVYSGEVIERTYLVTQTLAAGESDSLTADGVAVSDIENVMVRAFLTDGFSNMAIFKDKLQLESKG